MEGVSIVIDGEVVSQGEIEYEFFRHELIEALSGRIETQPPTKEIITQIIQLRAINLLAELKGVVTTSDEVRERISTYRQNNESIPVFKDMVMQFGEDKFWRFEEKRYYVILNTEKIKKDLIDVERERYKDNTDVSEDVLKYVASKKFDNLVVEAFGLLDISTSY